MQTWQIHKFLQPIISIDNSHNQNVPQLLYGKFIDLSKDGAQRRQLEGNKKNYSDTKTIYENLQNIVQMSSSITKDEIVVQTFEQNFHYEDCCYFCLFIFYNRKIIC